MSVAAHGISAGVDGIEGSRDDSHAGTQPGGKAISVSWYRPLDNNPLVVDGLVIQLGDYSRSPNFPAGSLWSASANKLVAESLGLPENTQSVMYSTQLAATGPDHAFGTSDDYTLTLSYAGECTGASTGIRVQLAPTISDEIGECANTAIDYSFPHSPPIIVPNYSFQHESPSEPVTITLDDSQDWLFGDVDLVVLVSDGGATPSPGDTVVYTVDISNAGTSNAENVTLIVFPLTGAVVDFSLSDPDWTPCGAECVAFLHFDAIDMLAHQSRRSRSLSRFTIPRRPHTLQ
jgi:hypothetical protein